MGSVNCLLVDCVLSLKRRIISVPVSLRLFRIYDLADDHWAFAKLEGVSEAVIAVAVSGFVFAHR